MEYNEKQLAIMDTAEKLFGQNGFNGTSVRDIAQEAGVNVAMISYYFGSKEKLMEMLFEQKSNKLTLMVETLIQDEKLSYLQKVYALIDDYVDRFVDQQAFHKIMIREQIAENGTGLANQILALKKRNLASIKKLIVGGQKDGEFKKNIDIVMMMATLVGTMSQMITSQCYYREVNNMESMDDAEFKKHLRKKLSTHLKQLFKAVLTNEA
jgi:AcrR family transcriptional regulator